MLWLQGQTISAGTKSAACRHLAHMDRLSRQLNQHRGISRFGRRNVRDADGSDASPLPRALRRHLRAEFTSGPHIRASVCGPFFFIFLHIGPDFGAALGLFSYCRFTFMLYRLCSSSVMTFACLFGRSSVQVRSGDSPSGWPLGISSVTRKKTIHTNASTDKHSNSSSRLDITRTQPITIWGSLRCATCLPSASSRLVNTNGELAAEACLKVTLKTCEATRRRASRDQTPHQPLAPIDGVNKLTSFVVNRLVEHRSRDRVPSWSQ